MKEITTEQLQQKLNENENLCLVDVRRDDEVAKGIIPQAKHIVLDEIDERFNELNKDETVYLICRSGGRSKKAGELLAEKGYDVVNVKGGMLAWEGDTK